MNHYRPHHRNCLPYPRPNFRVGFIAIVAGLCVLILLFNLFQRNSVDSIGIRSQSVIVKARTTASDRIKKTKPRTGTATATSESLASSSSSSFSPSKPSPNTTETKRSSVKDVKPSLGLFSDVIDSTPESKVTNKAIDETANNDDDDDDYVDDPYENDLSYYDPVHWETPPRIVIMSGPHKTASSTLQDFMMNVTGSVIWLGGSDPSETITKDFPKMTAQKLQMIHPHPNITDWVYPIGVPEDYYPTDSIAGGLSKVVSPSKFYARLAAYISGRRRMLWFRKWKKMNKAEKEAMVRKVRHYFRRLFQIPWDRQKKNLVIAAEAFDTLVEGLTKGDGSLGTTGEDMHVAANSGTMIDALLDVLPWDEDENQDENQDEDKDKDGDEKKTNISNNSKNSKGVSSHLKRRPPLQLEDIEVHIHFRLPRIKHAISIWHQLGKKKTLREFLTKEKSVANLYQSNSLALALQYVRRGIKTTLVDMKGVAESEKLSPETGTTGTDDDSLGGLQAVAACEVLRLGRGDDDSERPRLCDGDGRLHLHGWYEPELKNRKEDKLDRMVTDDQLEEIDSLLNEYDCDVWKHLQDYRSEGILRILHPSDDLFATCGGGNYNSENSDKNEIPFHAVLQRVRNIANRESRTRK